MPAQTPSPFNGIFLLWALWGAIVDWRYKRRGGVKPTTRDRLLFVVGVGICLAILVSLGLGGARAESLGSLAGFFTIAVFALWELGRWRVRRVQSLKKF